MIAHMRGPWFPRSHFPQEPITFSLLHPFTQRCYSACNSCNFWFSLGVSLFFSVFGVAQNCLGLGHFCTFLRFFQDATINGILTFWVFFKTSRAPKSRPPDPLRAGCGATFGECVFFQNLPGMASFWGSLGGCSPPSPRDT